MHISAIVAAGGKGERLGGGVRKQLRTVGGRTLLERSVTPFDGSQRIAEIILVLPADLVASPPDLVRGIRTPVRLVAGGGRRQDSVAGGLGALAPESEIVVIHDAARPFCTPAVIGRTIDAAAECGAATAALPAFDTVKEGRVEDGATLVGATLQRERVFLVQTPQAFRVDLLRDAVARGGGADATDEATLVERAGHPVRLVQGDVRNFKVTSRDDLALAEQLVSAGQVETRVGLGYDLHRFVEGRPLVLGGVSIPGPRGLLGHSDADAVCHAVTDAVLGAAGAGDIGQLYPDDDDRWKGAASIELLRDAMGAVRKLGFAVGNVDVVVVTERPKIRAVAGTMRQRLAEVLLVAPERISVKGKTGEGVGEVGRGEALVVHAIAMLTRPSDNT
ncbi:MAG: 2-C-methyl-D-erythritol 4-phosphate cytidylyltransferase [Acidobacteria bacterium]|nr:2-C-methyl-D-erythritol 4-phosphate cytidylyltransferase [Acidobacteriota bacterium]